MCLCFSVPACEWCMISFTYKLYVNVFFFCFFFPHSVGSTPACRWAACECIMFVNVFCMYMHCRQTLPPEAVTTGTPGEDFTTAARSLRGGPSWSRPLVSMGRRPERERKADVLFPNFNCATFYVALNKILHELLCVARSLLCQLTTLIPLTAWT